MVYRVYVEKKPGQTHEADGLLREVKDFLQIGNIESVRVLNRYDAENIEEKLFDYAVNTVFSEPQVDNVSFDIPTGKIVFAVEPLPGQFDQRADSAAQCIQILGQCERPTIRSAKVYALEGELTQQDVDAIKKHVINAVESREASLEKPKTLAVEYAAPQTVATVDGFIALDAAGLVVRRQQVLQQQLGIQRRGGHRQKGGALGAVEHRQPQPLPNRAAVLHLEHILSGTKFSVSDRHRINLFLVSICLLLSVAL